MAACYLDPAMMGGGVSLPTYTGQMQIVKFAPGKYYAFLKTSGTLAFPTEMTLDAFLVGGGGGGSYGGNNDHSWVWDSKGGSGGGGGYVTVAKEIAAEQITAIIGQGGVGAGRSGSRSGADGGATSFGAYTALGGKGSVAIGTYDSTGGAGGSGGGGAGRYWHSSSTDKKSIYPAGRGGSDGSSGQGSGVKDGVAGTIGGPGSGVGSGATTRPFGGDRAPFSSMFYAGGGGGGADDYVTGAAGGDGGGGRGANVSGIGGDGVANTGGGGGGGARSTNIAGSGGSGVVIIRWPSWKWK